jgi:hypothetical protein
MASWKLTPRLREDGKLEAYPTWALEGQGRYQRWQAGSLPHLGDDGQAVFDAGQAVDPAEGLLRHLLLEVRANFAVQDDAAVLGFNSQLASRQIRAGVDGQFYTLGKVRFGDAHA